MSTLSPAAEIAVIMTELGAAEKLVVLRIARRVLQGQHDHGPFNLATDKRNWREERFQELADALVYGAVNEVQNGHEGC